MSVPTSRETFKQYCLRRLGAPVVEVNLADEQIDDCIDTAIRFWHDYHWDGTEKTYFKYKVTDQDRRNRYLQMPENIIGAIEVFPPGEALSTNNMFNIRYQIALNDLYTLTNVSMIPYYMAFQHIEFLEYMLVGQKPIRYNRTTNRLYVDADWSLMPAGEYVIVVAYQVIDPEEWSRAWSDYLLQRHACALLKQQWGTNLTKFSSLPLPGGITFNAQKMYDDATREREEIERMVMDNNPPLGCMG
jgi:hypothetical protein